LINKSFPDINLNWLISGKGEMNFPVTNDFGQSENFDRLISVVKEEVEKSRSLIKNKDVSSKEQKDEILLKYGDILNSDQEASVLIIGAISNHPSNGSDYQKISFHIHDKYTAVSKLFKLGMRNSAVKLAFSLLKEALYFQHHYIALDICNTIVRHYYLVEEKKENAEEYNDLYNKISKVIELEHLAQNLFGELSIYSLSENHSKTKPLLQKLVSLKRKFPIDSMLYRYYYHKSNLLNMNGKRYEIECKRAIEYFEDANFKQSALLSSFVNNLAEHYTKTNQLKKGEIILYKYLAICESGSSPWFRYMKTLTLLHLERNDLKNAKTIHDTAVHNTRFEELTKTTQNEWNTISDRIMLN
jgi:hypothetical protein